MLVTVTATTATTTTPASTFLQYKCGSRTTTASPPGPVNSSSDTVEVEPTIWVYTGSLMDPYTGQQICNVQGIEYIQPIAQVTIGEDNYSDQTKSTQTGWFQQPYRRRCRPLQITSVIDDYIRQQQQQQQQQHQHEYHSTTTNHHHDAPHDVVQCHTILSRKLFCYTPPTTVPRQPEEQHHSIQNDTETLSNSLFTSFRRPGLGPTQSIPVDQAIMCYDSIISAMSGRCCRRRRRMVPSSTTAASSLHPTNDPSVSSVRPWWILHTEIPSTGPTTTNQNRSSRDRSHCIWSCIDPHPSSSSSSSLPSSPQQQRLDFSIFTRRQSVPLSLTSIIADVSTTNTNHPPNHTKRRRPWLQIGSTSHDSSGSGGSRKNELGVRETYQYYRSESTGDRTASLHNDLTLRYTRYGEAPVWYGPGRVCVLDLTGTRIQSPLPSSEDRADSYVDDQVIDTVRHHVPVISSILLNFIPDFWNVLPLQPTRTSNNNQQSTSRHKQNDKHFMYFADALHPALQSQEGEDVQGNDDCHRRILLKTAHEYGQYYNDLAMGRQLRQLVNPAITTRLSPPQQLLQRMEYEHRCQMSTTARRCQQVTNAIQNTIGTAWDKLRTASTLSIW